MRAFSSAICACCNSISSKQHVGLGDLPCFLALLRGGVRSGSDLHQLLQHRDAPLLRQHAIELLSHRGQQIESLTDVRTAAPAATSCIAAARSRRSFPFTGTSWLEPSVVLALIAGKDLRVIGVVARVGRDAGLNGDADLRVDLRPGSVPSIGIVAHGQVAGLIQGQRSALPAPPWPRPDRTAPDGGGTSSYSRGAWTAGSASRRAGARLDGARCCDCCASNSCGMPATKPGKRAACRTRRLTSRSSQSTWCLCTNLGPANSSIELKPAFRCRGPRPPQF